MSKKAADAGKSFMAGVLAKLPETLRAQAEQLFAAPEAADALVVIGTGALAQPDINRRYDELQKQTTELTAKHQELSQWWEANHTALEEYKVIKPEYDRLKGTSRTPAEEPPERVGVGPEELAEMFDARDRAFAQVTSLGLKLIQKHGRMFNEELDTDELIADTRVGRVIPGTNRVFGIMDAYNARYGERIQAKEQEAETARINKLVEDRLAEERRKSPSQPFPLRDAQPSPLDVLEAGERPQHNVETAIAEYERLQAARGLGG